ncbi:MAG: adenylosuccinate lyase family protein [Chromatiales bacterium]|jgi:3-carboxy-cis,cis-muconate cycloisomerase|nr:adenylosuccinate lyase family protein [Chromatiales bacterium]
MSLEPSSLRISDPGIRELFTQSARWQSWLDVEAALAEAEAELGMIPAAAAKVIRGKARLELLDSAAIHDGLVRTAHPLVPLVWELARVCGDEVGGYVHWGATTQNILETGDALQLRRAHQIMLSQMAQLLSGLADVAERAADVPAAGRTHGQHAVPITFGYKVAVWIDELLRHVDRLRELEPRVFVAMLGGAAGTFASFGEQGFDVQSGMARILNLAPVNVPSRTHRDREAEYVCTLGLMAGTAGKIGGEMYTLMKDEFREAGEPVPPGTVGSSTMPQKRNPILAQDIRAGSAQIRALVPLALESMMTEHEADRTTTVMMRAALGPACVHMGDILARLIVIAEGLWYDEARMRRNLDLTEGMILAEAVMLELGKQHGRQVAHDLVYDAVEEVNAKGAKFSEVLGADPRIRAELDEGAIAKLLDPSAYTGLCSTMARQQAQLARECAAELRAAPIA